MNYVNETTFYHIDNEFGDFVCLSCGQRLISTNGKAVHSCMGPKCSWGSRMINVYDVNENELRVICATGIMTVVPYMLYSEDKILRDPFNDSI